MRKSNLPKHSKIATKSEANPPSTDWRQIRDDLINASQEHTEAQIAYVEAGQARAHAEQIEREASARLTAAQKRHEQAQARAGIEA